MATAPAEVLDLDLNKVTTAYLKIREARSVIKKEYEAKDDNLKGQLKMLEATMLSHLNKHGMTTAKTDTGTFWKQEDMTPSITDDVAFYGWIKENDAFDALERRVKKTFINTFAEAHDGALPPGISTYREFVIRVRRPQ